MSFNSCAEFFTGGCTTSSCRGELVRLLQNSVRALQATRDGPASRDEQVSHLPRFVVLFMLQLTCCGAWTVAGFKNLSSINCGPSTVCGRHILLLVQLLLHIPVTQASSLAAYTFELDQVLQSLELAFTRDQESVTAEAWRTSQYMSCVGQPL